MDNVVLALNCFATVFFVVSAYCVAMTARAGRSFRGGTVTAVALDAKLGYLSFATCTLLSAIGIVLIKAWVTGIHYPMTLSSAPHYAADALLVGSFLLIRAKYNGTQHPGTHGWLVYVFLGAYVVGWTTGIIRLWSF